MNDEPVEQSASNLPAGEKESERAKDPVADGGKPTEPAKAAKRNGLDKIRWEQIVPVLAGGLLALLGSAATQAFQLRLTREQQWAITRLREVEAAARTILDLAELADAPVAAAEALCAAEMVPASNAQLGQLRAAYDQGLKN